MPILSNFPGGAGSGSGGVTLGAVSNINVLVASGKVYVNGLTLPILWYRVLRLQHGVEPCLCARPVPLLRAAAMAL